MKKSTFALILVLAICISILPSSTCALESAASETTNYEDCDTVAALAYSSAPDNIYPFIYKGSNPYLSVEIDTVNCVQGALYVYDDSTKMLLLISAGPVEVYTATQDALYYISTDNQVICSDYSESSGTVVGSVLGTATSFDYFDGVLSFVENETSVVFMDAETGVRTVVHTAEGIQSIYRFDRDKLIWWDAEDRAFYLNTTTGENTALENDFEVNCMIAPYITPSTTTANINLRSTTTENALNDITFPLANYSVPASGTNSSYTTAVSFFNKTDTSRATCNHGGDLCDSKRYGGHTQCFGFAIYAHDCYLHIEDWTKTSEGWATGDFIQCAQIVNGKAVVGEEYRFTTAEDVKDFYDSLEPGAYIRYGKDSDESPENGVHSIVLASKDDNGFYAYECNQDSKCGVYLWYYTYSYLPGRYQYVHNYVNHTFEPAVYENTSTHTVPCANCDGYLRQDHSGDVVYRIKSLTQHTRGYACCEGGVDYTHTPASSRTLVNASVHAVKFSCCEGTVQQAHTVAATYTYTDLVTHRISATCCAGTLSQAHTQRSYIIYSTTQHQISFRCCNQLIYQNHVFNSAGTCTGCGYVEGGFVVQPGKKPVIEETE